MARNIRDMENAPKRIQVATDFWVGINKTGKALVIVIDDRPFLARVSEVLEVINRTPMPNGQPRKGARLVELVEISTPEATNE